MNKTVELRWAYEWTCEECGRNQFVSATVPEMDNRAAIELAQQLGVIEAWQDALPPELPGAFVTCPDSVTCGACGHVFATKHWLDDGAEPNL